MTDTDALTERIARVLHEIDPITGHGHDWGKLSNVERKFYRHKAAAVLPVLQGTAERLAKMITPAVAVEVRKAKAEALREAAPLMHDFHDAAWLETQAAEYETGAEHDDV